MTYVRRVALAYLLGAYLSDGHLGGWLKCTDPHTRWQVADEAFADNISRALSSIDCSHSYNQYYASRYSGGRYWRVEERAACCLGNWLWKVSGDKERLPEMPAELVRPLVAGLMDGDGCVASRKGTSHYQLSYAGSKGFVKDFYRLLEKQNVSVGQFGFAWYINIESFLRAGLTFAIPRKQDLLALWCRQRFKMVKQRGRSDDLRKADVAERWMLNVWNKNILAPTLIDKTRIGAK